ncbi:hypothetical protein [Rothia uropygialis]|nr:hypothetical protein [Kocuria sp. 36]
MRQKSPSPTACTASAIVGNIGLVDVVDSRACAPFLDDEKWAEWAHEE